MGVLRVFAAIAGFAIIAGTASSVLRTLVVPRGVLSRLSETVLDTIVRLSRMIGDRVTDYARRDEILAWSAPLSLMTLLLSWLAAFWIGFSLVDYALTHLAFFAAMREAGSSIATLGFAASPRGSLTVLNVFTGLTGMIVVALQIGYLPTLYSAYNQRETLVTLLAARAGEPAWGQEVLARHAWLGLLENLPDLYSDWERWAATVSETHTSYPVLIHFRSPQPLRSWLVSLLAVMDAAALQWSVAPATAPIEGRLLLRMGYLALRDVAAIESISVRHDPSPDDQIELTFEEFEVAIETLTRVGMPIERTAAEAWPHFRGWRINYEEAAYGLAKHIDAVPALWAGSRRRGDAAIPPVRPVNRQPGNAKSVSPANRQPPTSVRGEVPEEGQ